MTDTGKSKHWDFLAEELGADVQPADTQPPAEESKLDEEPRQPIAQTPEPKPQRPKPAPAPTDWGDVASVLGVSPSSADETAGEERPADEPSATKETEKAPVNFEDEADYDDDDSLGFDFEPDLSFECNLFAGGLSIESKRESPPEADVPVEAANAPEDQPPTEYNPPENFGVEAADVEQAAPEEDTASAAAEEKDEPKKRRRRRGRRGSGNRSSNDKAAEAETDSPAVEAGGGAAFGVEIESDDDGLVSPAASDEAADEEAEPSPTRPKRKRRRRGGRKSAPKKDVNGEEVADDEIEVLADVEEPSTEISSGEVDDAKGERGKHRAIPSWGDAIGVIVETNLAARAKKSSSGSTSSRGRGRRGRGKPSGGK